MKKIVVCLFIMLGCLVAKAQNVGIGTTAPESKLHIKGTADGSQLIITKKTLLPYKICAPCKRPFSW